MVIAGHETVAAALAWTLMLLAEHQPAQDRVRAELAAHPGPVPLLGHRDAAAVDAGRRRRGAAALPAGLGALPALAPAPTSSAAARSRPARWSSSAPGSLHRRADAWPDPLAFRPERFLDAGAGALRATCRSGRGRACASGASSRWARWSWC